MNMKEKEKKEKKKGTKKEKDTKEKETKKKEVDMKEKEDAMGKGKTKISNTGVFFILLFIQIHSPCISNEEGGGDKEGG